MKFRFLLAAVFGVASFLCVAHAQDDPFGSGQFEGAVYTQTNDPTGNGVLAYGRRANGTLEFLGIFGTGGRGTGLAGSGFPFFDTGDGLDPMQSTNAVELSTDRQFLFVINGASSSVSTFRIGRDLRPRLTSVTRVTGFGPNSITYRDGVVYVSSVDADGQFDGSLGEVGLFEAFRLTQRGRLVPIRGSVRRLSNRPGGIDVTPNGRFLVVTSLNAGSGGAGDGPSFADNLESVVIYGLARNGMPSRSPLSSGISLPVDATPGAPDPDVVRASTIALGLETIEDDGRQFVVVTEARSVAFPNGFPTPPLTPGFPGEGVIPLFQPGGVSSWEILPDGELVLIDALPVNDNPDEIGLGTGQSATCWVQFSADGKTFWVVNTIDSSISAFRFNKGEIEIIAEVVAQGDGLGDAVPDEVTPPDLFPIELADAPAPRRVDGFARATFKRAKFSYRDRRRRRPAPVGDGVDFDSFGGPQNPILNGTDAFLDFRISDDGKFIYQTLGLDRGILVYRVDEANEDGEVSGLTLIQEVLTPELPAFNIQGIEAF